MNNFFYKPVEAISLKNRAEESARNYLFDNLKAVMLFLVAIGHILDPLIVEQTSLYRYLMQYIYLFHMPMFAFITGYFSKDVEKAKNHAVKKALIPYLFWQSLYLLTALIFIRLGLATYNTNVFKLSLLLPSSPLYYLLCVFMWKSFLKDIVSLRHPIYFSIFAGVLISLVFDPAFHIGWGACFSLLVFFILGFYCTTERIESIRRIPRSISVLILLLAVIPATMLPYSFRNVRFTYASVGLHFYEGIFYRILFYGIAVLMIIAFINLFPERKAFFSRIGTNAILVYAGSSFAAPALYLVLLKWLPISTDSVWGNLIGMSVFSFLLIFFCSMEWMKQLYDFTLKKINDIIFKDERL